MKRILLATFLCGVYYMIYALPLGTWNPAFWSDPCKIMQAQYERQLRDLDS